MCWYFKQHGSGAEIIDCVTTLIPVRNHLAINSTELSMIMLLEDVCSQKEKILPD